MKQRPINRIEAERALRRREDDEDEDEDEVCCPRLTSDKYQNSVDDSCEDDDEDRGGEGVGWNSWTCGDWNG